MSKIINIYIVAFLILFLFSCSQSYQKVVKSTDPDYKLKRAKEYYEKGDCGKSLPLFEELITVFKGTKSIDDIYYMYATCHFEQGNFLVAGFHFKNIHDSYPLSEYAEECLYMNAYSYYSMSPNINLDQTYTEKAIGAFQLYINSYPNSTRMSECNNLMTILRRKLESKSFKTANLYLNTGNYKAAAKAFEILLKQYPDTPDAEQSQFLIIKSNYLYAQNSISSKQVERYENAIKACNLFLANYSGSDYTDEATTYIHSSKKNIEELIK